MPSRHQFGAFVRGVSALVVLAACAGASPASAALVLTQSFDDFFTTPTLVVQSTGLGAFATQSTAIVTPTFSASTGVLTGASFSASSRVTSSAHLDASGGGAIFGVIAATGDGDAGASLSGAGFSAIALGNPFSIPLHTDADCSGIGSCGSVPPPVSAPISGSRTIGAGALGAYLSGPSQQAIMASISATADCQSNATSCSYKNTVSFGTISSTFNFEYLLHAAPSFSADGSVTTLNLDLGEITQGSAAGSVAFSLFNFATDAANTIGLDLDSVTGTGNTGVLTTNLGQFDDLAAGGGAGFSAFLDSSNVGDFTATYLLRLSDADIGVGQRNDVLLLRLFGRVAAAQVPPPGVPEPAAWALMLVGFGAVGGVLRRRSAAFA